MNLTSKDVMIWTFTFERLGMKFFLYILKLLVRLYLKIREKYISTATYVESRNAVFKNCLSVFHNTTQYIYSICTTRIIPVLGINVSVCRRYVFAI